MNKYNTIILAAWLSVCFSCSRLESANQSSKLKNETEKTDIWLMEDMKDAMTPGVFSPGTANAEHCAKEKSVKTHTELSDDASYATVVWDAGDKFTMYAYNASSDRFNYSVYTTPGGGASAQFNYNYTVSTGPCFSIYPEATKLSLYNNAPIFGVNVPVTQTATPGSVSPGAAVSLCKTNTQVSEFHFYNAVSFVKFRLLGSAVSSVTSVSLKGISALAGDTVLMTEEDGTPTLTREIYFNGDTTSRTVTLTGNFETGKDYYFAVFPGEQSGFSMLFSDGTQTKTLISSNHLPLVRSAISDLGTIDIGDTLEEEERNDAILYIEATSGKTPVSVAVIPEGFRKEELDDYELLAKSGIDALFSTEPFKTYKEYFNVWILKVASNESGASITDGNGTVTTARDTYFQSSWGTDSYNDMTADLDKVLAFVEDHCPDIVNGVHSAIDVPVLMIINDTRYGGICHTYSNGRCVGMVPYINEGNGLTWAYPGIEAASDESAAGGTRTVTNTEKQALGISSGDWKNVLIHEFGGHGFSRLLDEYWYNSYLSVVTEIASHFWSVPYGLNISASYSDPPWKEELLDNQSALTSLNPLYDRIGVWQGGMVSVFNRWRSEKVSCMMDNRRYFSTWQRMIIVRRILSIAGETFDTGTFFSKDDPSDPLRDIISAYTMRSATENIPPKLMPMLPGPVFHE